MLIAVGRRRPSRALLSLAVAASGIVFVLHAEGRAESCVSNPAPSASASPSPSASPSGTPTPTPSGLPSGLPTLAGSDAAGGRERASGGTGDDPAQTHPCPSTVSLDVSPPTGTYGTAFKIAGKLTCNGTPLMQVEMRLKRMLQGEGRFHQVLTARTNDAGAFSFLDAPSRDAEYQAVWQPDTDDDSNIEEVATLTCAAAASPKRAVEVRPGIVLNQASKGSPRRGTAVVFDGKLLPAHPGQKVHLQALLQNQWRNVSTVTLGSSSAYRFSYVRKDTGMLMFRVAYPTQHADHSWNVSRYAKVTWTK